MEFSQLPPEEIEQIREKVQPVIGRYRGEIGEDIVNQTTATARAAADLPLPPWRCRGPSVEWPIPREA